MPRGERGWGRTLLLAALFAALGAALFGAGSCSFVLDFSAATDAGIADASIDAGDAGDPCSYLEPNNDLPEAVQIEPGTFGLGICTAGDEDYFRFDIEDNRDFFTEIRFDSSTGDLVLRLYRASDGALVDTSSTFDDVERIEHTAAMANQLAAGSYIIEVSGQASGETNNYVMEVSITSPPGTPDAGVLDAAI